MTVLEEWENHFDGYSRPRGTTEWVIDLAKAMLPPSEISPTCKRKGHKWLMLGTPLYRDACVYGCERCAKRGRVVLKTVGITG